MSNIPAVSPGGICICHSFTAADGIFVMKGNGTSLCGMGGMPRKALTRH